MFVKILLLAYILNNLARNAISLVKRAQIHFLVIVVMKIFKEFLFLRILFVDAKKDFKMTL